MKIDVKEVSDKEANDRLKDKLQQWKNTEDGSEFLIKK